MSKANSWLLYTALFAFICAFLTGCSIRTIALNQVSSALSGSGTSFSSGNDPELVKAAIPFSLMLMETVLTENPRHEGFLLACSQGFTQYAYAFVMVDADEAEDSHIDQSKELRNRGRLLFLRARDYGLRGLEVRHSGIGAQLKANLEEAVRSLNRSDVPFLYWSALLWAGAVSSTKDNDLIADITIIDALVGKAYDLDESYDNGGLNSFLITYVMSREDDEKKAEKQARRHFDRAVELSKGLDASPFMALAEQSLALILVILSVYLLH